MSQHLADVKKFWEEQAKQFGADSLATSPDTIAFNLEIEEMKRQIPEGSRILDVGCGSGVKGVALAQALAIEYHGLDYSAEMVAAANALAEKEKGSLKGSVQFYQGSVLDPLALDGDPTLFDLVMSDRCLINLETLENQSVATRHLAAKLKPGGSYLMFENSLQSLEKLNEARRPFDLDDVTVRWHNIYIDEGPFFGAVKDIFTLRETVSFASTYYLISRTLNALLTPEGEQPDYLSAMNMLAAKLPPTGDFGPIKLFILDKV